VNLFCRPQGASSVQCLQRLWAFLTTPFRAVWTCVVLHLLRLIPASCLLRRTDPGRVLTTPVRAVSNWPSAPRVVRKKTIRDGVRVPCPRLHGSVC
jgi:hypothetical protein